MSIGDMRFQFWDLVLSPGLKSKLLRITYLFAGPLNIALLETLPLLSS